MLRGNPNSILCEEQSKFILDRIVTTERHFNELGVAFSEFTKKVSRVRDKMDELAHITQDFSDCEKYNKTMATALSSVSKAVTLIADFKDVEVRRLESKIVSELAQHETMCKHRKENVKEAIIVRDKELAKRKQLEHVRARNGRAKRNATDTEIIKSNLEVTKSLKDMEEIVEKFEKQKLQNLKSLLLDFILIELKMHTKAVEVLSATYQDISDVDENKDYQGIHKELKRQNRQFKKHLQQDGLSDRYFLQRIKSQSMGALNATLAGLSVGRRNKSLSSSNSLNSSQDPEHDQPGGLGAKRSSKTSVQRSVESLDSLKRDLSSESKTSTDDSEDETESESNVEEAGPSVKTSILEPKPIQTESKFKIINLKDYNP